MNTSQSPPAPPGITTVFLDRDGVLNEKMPEGHYVASWENFHLLPGTVDSIARLNRAGLRVVVVSNQRGISLGLYTADDVDVIHTRFQQLLESRGAHVDAFYFCPHDQRACACRKPQSGMFEQAVVEFPAITAVQSVMIGDSLSDIEFGRNLGMRTIFIEGDPNRRKPGGETAAELANFRCPSLTEAVEAVLSVIRPSIGH